MKMISFLIPLGGGAGTTYIAAEIKKRKWIGSEIGPLDDIRNRFKDIHDESRLLENIRDNYNNLFTRKNLKKREKKGLWTPESVRKPTAVNRSAAP